MAKTERSTRKAPLAEIDPALKATSELAITDLKPHLSGTLWRLSDVGAVWTAELAHYVQHVEAILRSRATQIVARGTATTAENTKVLHLPAFVCDQRREVPLDDGSLLRRLNSVDLVRLTQGDYVAITGFAIQHTGRPQWTRSAILTDSRWELLTLSFAWPYILVSHTGTKRHGDIVEYLNDVLADIDVRRVIERVPRSIPDQAFLGEQTYNAILGGVHRPRETKPDKKSLTGLDLRKALDPYDDQTFAYIYGVAKMRLSQLRKLSGEPDIGALIDRAFPREKRSASRPPSLGYGQSNRTVVIGSSKDVVEFARRLDIIRLLLLLTAQLRDKDKSSPYLFEPPEGIGYLSSGVTRERISDVNDPFEASFNTSIEGFTKERREELDEILEEWNEHGELTPERVTRDKLGGVSVSILATWDDLPLARLTLDFTTEDVDDGLHSVARVMELLPGGKGEDAQGIHVLNYILDVFRENPVDLRFESGHVFLNGQLYLPSLTEILFERWEWISPVLDGKSYAMTKEKPPHWRFTKTKDPVSKIEKSRSLFSRIALDVPELFDVNPKSTSWALLCNDQPEEVADYIFIDAAKDQRRLAFVHVKKAGHGKNRDIAVGHYDIVATQAVKNLRHIDLELLESRFERPDLPPREIGIFMVKSDGKMPVLSNETLPFLETFRALRRFGPPLRTQVICYAPHVRKTTWERQYKLRESPHESPSRAAYMLSMLLLSARADCSRVNAEFEVWSENDEVTTP